MNVHGVTNSMAAELVEIHFIPFKFDVEYVRCAMAASNCVVTWKATCRRRIA
eukprot:m.16678 g.16678  ORF g.16678 m.16678 type:complete len:52 (-) comp11020_c0_seq1:241-396(-)